MEGITEEVVQEAMQRDPNRDRPWVMLVGGHKDQIKVVERVFKRHDIQAARRHPCPGIPLEGGLVFL